MRIFEAGRRSEEGVPAELTSPREVVRLRKGAEIVLRGRTGRRLAETRTSESAVSEGCKIISCAGSGTAPSVAPSTPGNDALLFGRAEREGGFCFGSAHWTEQPRERIVVGGRWTRTVFRGRLSERRVVHVVEETPKSVVGEIRF